MNRLNNPHTPPTAASSIDLEGGDQQDVVVSEGSDNDGCSSLASDVPSLDRSVSESSDASSSNQDTVPPLTRLTPRKPRFLRQRNSGLNDSSSNNTNPQINNSASSDAANAPPAPLQPLNQKDGSGSVPTVAADFIPQFLLPQNMSAPIPKGPVRKHSDFEMVAYKGVDVEYSSNSNNNNCNSNNNNNNASSDPAEQMADLGIGRFRNREEIVLHFIMELNMLRRDWAIIFFGVTMQWFHSILTNLAYYYHTQLSAAQRIPLKDIAYDTLPVLNGAWWMVSEYLFLFMVATTILSIASILVIRWNPPHGRPLYCIPIIRRLFMTLSCCQVLRCISFLITTLPGASRQCLYDVPEDMSREELMLGPAHDRGNPHGWAPPITMHDIIWRMDATKGCGDLMFSSHTIFTMLFVCLIWRYFNWGLLKYTMLAMQIIMIPFILAAHKHYSVDIFTALYVTPLVFEVLKMRFRDQDLYSVDMASHYGIRFHRSFLNFGVPTVVMSLRGGEFYVEPADIPVDLQRSYFGQSSCNKLGYGTSCDLDLYEEDMDYPSEYDPVIV